jgi:arsenate reductase-like glutaredoxin family protein
MNAKVYGINHCDIMKKAFAWLDAHRVEYEFHDQKKAGVPPGTPKAWAKRTGREAPAEFARAQAARFFPTAPGTTRALRSKVQ